MPVLIREAQRLVRIDKHKLRRSLTKALAMMDCQQRELSLLLADDAAIRELNRRYRGRDRPTNVLAFPFPEGPKAPDQPSLLGDVVISVETARRECAAWGHEVEPHVLFLALHGLLHLLGHEDEASAEQAREMSDVQEDLFLSCQ